MPYLSVSKTHISIHKLTYKPDIDLLKSLGGRAIPISRRVGQGMAFQFPRRNYFIHMIRRALGKSLEEDATVAEFLARDPALVLYEETDPRLFEYQKEGVQFLSGGNRLLAIPPGRGKTPIAVSTCEALGFLRILVVAPIILLRQWEEEIRKWDRRDLPVTMYRTSKVVPSAFGYTLTNYEMIVRNTALFAASKWDVMILDESILVRNRKAVRTKALEKVRKVADTVWELSGFPMVRDMSDLWSQFHLLEPQSFRSYWTFVNEYCRVTQGVWGAEILGSKPDLNASEEFRDIMKIVPENVIDIPMGHIERLSVELTPKQRRIYDKAQNDFLLEVQGGDLPIQNRLTQMARLSQIVSNLSFAGGEIESGKLTALEEMNEIGYLRSPTLIWCRFTESIRGVVATLQHLNLVVEFIDGSTPEDLRQKTLQKYKEGGLDVLVMNLTVGKYGLNLTNTRTMIYYDLSFNLDDLNQSFYRVFRIGLEHMPNVFALSAEGTIDDLIRLNLDGKLQDIADASDQELLQLFELLRGKKS